jgi:hypothetical protein
MIWLLVAKFGIQFIQAFFNGLTWSEGFGFLTVDHQLNILNHPCPFYFIYDVQGLFKGLNELSNSGIVFLVAIYS